MAALFMPQLHAEQGTLPSTKLPLTAAMARAPSGGAVQARSPAARLTSFIVQPPTAISTLRLGFFCLSAIVSPYSWLSSFHSTGLNEKSGRRALGGVSMASQ